MPNHPTLIFVHGSWHTASTWERLTAILEPLQYKCICPTLPSTTGSPSITFADDIQAVRSLIIAETSQGRNVVVVQHSYGGQVGNSAIKGLPRQQGATESTSGHVIGIVMLATGFTVTGLSFMDGLGGKPPPSWIADEESGMAVLVADPRHVFYHDLPKEDGDYWVSKLSSQSLKALFEGGAHSYAGWKDVPVWYLATNDDQGHPIQAQQMFIQMAKDEGADVTFREIESSHSPMLSKPKEVADFILEAVEALTK